MAEMLEKLHTTGPFEVDEFSQDQRADLKKLFKEAANEWLDDKYSAFGRWSFWGLLAMVFIGLVFFAMTMQGWHLSKDVADAAEIAK
jgi:hypothetical protein